MPRYAGHRLVTVHLLVENLEVPATWRVGRAVFRPVGWLRERLRRDMVARDVPQLHRDFAMPPLQNAKWSSAGVQQLHPVDSSNYARAAEAARDATRDAIGVLRLLQRTRYPGAPRNVQVFGLPNEVGSTLEFHWVEDSQRHIIAAGGRWRGSIGRWEFTRGDIYAYHRDPRFRYLDAALRSGLSAGWEQRLIRAIRTVAVATSSVRPSLRIVLLATALEALLGEEFVSGWRFDAQGKAIKHPQASAHVIAQRAAYLSCIENDGVRRHPRSPTCEYLAFSTQTKLRENAYARQQGGDYGYCSAYERVAQLFVDRNTALHGANDDFTEQTAAGHEVTVDNVLIAALDWVLAGRAADVEDLASEIAALPSI